MSQRLLREDFLEHRVDSDGAGYITLYCLKSIAGSFVRTSGGFRMNRLRNSIV
jgi:hypothetical protein